MYGRMTCIGFSDGSALCTGQTARAACAQEDHSLGHVEVIHQVAQQTLSRHRQVGPDRQAPFPATASARAQRWSSFTSAWNLSWKSRRRARRSRVGATAGVKPMSFMATMSRGVSRVSADCRISTMPWRICGDSSATAEVEKDDAAERGAGCRGWAVRRDRQTRPRYPGRRGAWEPLRRLAGDQEVSGMGIDGRRPRGRSAGSTR